MVGTLAPFDAIAHERQQGCVLLLRRTEKRTDMAVATKRRTSKGDRFTRHRHDTFLLWGSANAVRKVPVRFIPNLSSGTGLRHPSAGSLTKPSARIPGIMSFLGRLVHPLRWRFVAARSALTRSGATTRKNLRHRTRSSHDLPRNRRDSRLTKTN